jgi:uncharacterized protein (TIRG00374 family)
MENAAESAHHPAVAAVPPVEQPTRRRLLGSIVFVAITGIGLYVVWPSLLDLFSAWPQLLKLNPAWLVLMFVLESASFACLWALLRLALHTRGWFAVATSQLASNAVSRVIPGGAATGGALQYQMLVRAGMDGARAASGLTAVSLITTATLLGLPVLSLPAILGGAPVARGLLTTALLGAGVFLVALAIGAVLLTTNRPLEVIGRTVQGLRNRIRRRTAPMDGLPARLIRERDLIRHILGQQWWVAVITSVGRSLLDYLALMAALMAVGSRPRPSLVLLAYVVSQLLGMIPITPGGLGFVEAGLTGTLVLAGVSSGDAILATLAYRLVSYWLPLPEGLGAYLLFRRRYGAPPRVAAPAGSRHPGWP